MLRCDRSFLPRGLRIFIWDGPQTVSSPSALYTRDGSSPRGCESSSAAGILIYFMQVIKSTVVANCLISVLFYFRRRHQPLNAGVGL